jgi:hypothetical protein
VREGGEPPVPQFLTRATWVAPFFRKLSQSYCDAKPLRLFVPITYYVSASTDSLDERYIKLRVGLGALAGAWLAQQPSHGGLVRDKASWKQWVASQRGAIEALANSEDGERLLASVEAAGKPNFAAVVEIAFAALGVPAAPEMRVELQHADHVVDTGRLFGTGEVDWEEGDRRSALMRTMLVAMTALAVGYRGAIMGWEREAHRNYSVAPASWWPIAAEDLSEANKTWIVSGDRLYVDWPVFHTPRIPKGGLLERVAQFADRLGDKTNGVLRARVTPLPSRLDEPAAYDLRLILARDVDTQITLFSIVPGKKSLRVLGWGNEDVKLSTTTELDRFLAKLARSERVRAHVERLLLLSQERALAEMP